MPAEGTPETMAPHAQGQAHGTREQDSDQTELKAVAPGVALHTASSRSPRSTSLLPRWPPQGPSSAAPAEQGVHTWSREGKVVAEATPSASDTAEVAT